MRILCVADSFGLPREQVPYEDTWYYLLKQRFPEHDFYPSFIRGRMSFSLKFVTEETPFRFRPDIVCVQTGICDCAPRIINTYSYFWRMIITFFSRINKQNFFWCVIKSAFRRSPKRTYTSYKQFQRDLTFFLESMIESGVSKVIFIKISKPGEMALKHSPFWYDNIVRYNEVFDELKEQYKEQVYVVDPLGSGENSDYIAQDAYHPNAKGNEKVADIITPLIS